MRRFARFLLVAVVAATCFAGCGRQSDPRPLDERQRRELEERLQEIDDEERLHFEETQP